MSDQEATKDIISEIRKDSRIILKNIYKIKEKLRFRSEPPSLKDDRLFPRLDENSIFLNHQNDLIDYLKAQIVKLIKENNELKSAQLEKCPKCKSTLLVGEDIENAEHFELSESNEKTSSVLLEKEFFLSLSRSAEVLKRIDKHEQNFPIDSASSFNLKSESTFFENEHDIFTHSTNNNYLDESDYKLESALKKLSIKAVSEETDKKGSDFSFSIGTPTSAQLKQELEDRIAVLVETVTSLEEKAKSLSQEKILFERKLDSADKEIYILKESINILKEKVKITEDEKNFIETKLQEVTQYLAEAFKKDVNNFKK